MELIIRSYMKNTKVFSATFLALLVAYLNFNDELILILMLGTGLLLSPIIASFILRAFLSLIPKQIFKQVNNFFVTPLYNALFILVYIFVISGALIALSQIYQYLKNAVWSPVSLIDAFIYSDSTWAIDPENWLGIWELLDKIPLSIFLVLTGFMLAYWLLQKKYNTSSF